MLCITSRQHRMKNLFKKYFQSVLTPDEFNSFSDLVSQKKQESQVHRFMEEEWRRQAEEEVAERQNPLLLQRIKQVILREELSRSLIKTKRYAVGLKVAAVLVMGLLAVNVWMYRDKEVVDQKQITQTVRVPNGAKTKLELPDGSLVWLNSGSTISYASNFDKNRTVELQGEGFFDVVKSKNMFSVVTKSGSVEVLGTAFNVQAYKEGEFITTLERGQVEIHNAEGKDLGVLDPGDQVQLVDNKYVKKVVNTSIFTSWKDGKLIFVREPFPVTMKRLERWFNVEIEYSSADLEGLWFSGTIEQETINEVMDMLCKVAPVSYSYDSKKRTIKVNAIKEK